MSKVGKNPIPIPSGVNVSINRDNHEVTIKGKNGELTRVFDKRINIDIQEQLVVVTRSTEEKVVKMLHGLTRSLLANMVQGVDAGYSKRLELSGVGYRVALDKDELVINIGFSHPVRVKALPGTSFHVPADTIIEVKGIDKEKVGLLAAIIHRIRKPDPYKNKGIRYRGEKLIKKAGKALGKAGK
jgi:large subunit ribosomal protein L6